MKLHIREQFLHSLCDAAFAAILCVGTCAFAGETILYQFPGGNHGSDPKDGLVFDAAGDAYGTTYYGGRYGWGTVYQLQHQKTSWREIVLYNFRGGQDGYNPQGNLLIDDKGNLYGTTLTGGTGNAGSGGGTLYELQPSSGGWIHLVLYNFCSLGGCPDGLSPSGLIFDKSGNLYGTTVYGGNSCGEQGCGVVYKLSHVNGQWKETVLHSFDNNGDGYYPNPGLTFGKSGKLYGTTCCGGGYGAGIVFVLKPGKHGWNEVPLYAFDGSKNNTDANGYLTLDSTGAIFGTLAGSYNSGCTYQCGGVFKLIRSHGQWVETSVFTFNGLDGADPNPNLIKDRAGNYYGSASQGGVGDFGVVFKLIPGKVWTINLLYQFTGQGADLAPNPGMIVGPKGTLYGTTPGPYEQGQYDGEVFEVTP